MRFCIGQRVRHKVYAYRGVIFDWDPVATVEEQWIRQMGVSGREAWVAGEGGDAPRA